MRTKCIVFGCANHSNEGRFINDLCSPCYEMLTTGEIRYTNSFLKEINILREQNVHLRSILKTVL